LYQDDGRGANPIIGTDIACGRVVAEQVDGIVPVLQADEPIVIRSEGGLAPVTKNSKPLVGNS
jgi:hypothetical protein